MWQDASRESGNMVWIFCKIAAQIKGLPQQTIVYLPRLFSLKAHLVTKGSETVDEPVCTLSKSALGPPAHWVDMECRLDCGDLMAFSASARPDKDETVRDTSLARRNRNGFVLCVSSSTWIFGSKINCKVMEILI